MIGSIAIVIPIVSLFIYAVLFMIECGAAIFVCWPKLLGDASGGAEGSADGERLVHAYMNPVWEATNVFLVFTLVSLIAFFPGAVPVWGRALVVPFLVFLIVMGIRVAGMLYVFYGGGGNRAMKFLLLAANLLAPAVLFGGTLPYFLTGALPHGMPGWGLAIVIGLVMLAAIVLLSSLFFDYLRAKKGAPVASAAGTGRLPRVRALILWSFGAFLFFFVVAESFLQFAAPHAFSETAYNIIAVLAAVIFGVFVALRRSQGKIVATLIFSLGILLFGILFLATAVAQLPYIVYPALTVANSVTDPQSAAVLLDVFGVGAVLTIPALAFMYSLFAL